MEEYRDVTPDISREEMNKHGTAALYYLVGGFLVFLLFIGMRMKPLGIGLSGIAFVIGMVLLFSKDRANRKPGRIIALAGILGLCALFIPIPALKSFAVFFLFIGALGLFAVGVIRGFQFLRCLIIRG